MLVSSLDSQDRGYVLPKRQFTFTGLHGVITEKIQLLIAIDVSISNLTRLKGFTNRIVIHDIINYMLINRVDFMS